MPIDGCLVLDGSRHQLEWDCSLLQLQACLCGRLTVAARAGSPLKQVPGWRWCWRRAAQIGRQPRELAASPRRLCLQFGAKVRRWRPAASACFLTIECAGLEGGRGVALRALAKGGAMNKLWSWSWLGPGSGRAHSARPGLCGRAHRSLFVCVTSERERKRERESSFCDNNSQDQNTKLVPRKTLGFGGGMKYLSRLGEGETTRSLIGGENSTLTKRAFRASKGCEYSRVFKSS